MKWSQIALLIAVLGVSVPGLAQESSQLVGTYVVKENVECMADGRPERAPACIVESGEPNPLRGEIVISQATGSKTLRFTETLPYSRLNVDIMDNDTTDSFGSRWTQRVNRMDDNGFSYTQESLQKFADIAMYRRDDYELKQEDGKWYYLHTIQGETSMIRYKYFRKFLLEKQ